jgi:hypothetical protein
MNLHVKDFAKDNIGSQVTALNTYEGTPDTINQPENATPNTNINVVSYAMDLDGVVKVVNLA